MQSNLTAEREGEIKQALTDYRLPLLTRIFNKVWFCFLRYTFAPVFLLLVILFVIYNSLTGWSDFGDTIWVIAKSIMLFYIFGIGGIALLSNICENISVGRLEKRLGITHDELQYYVTIFQIKG